MIGGGAGDGDVHRVSRDREGRLFFSAQGVAELGLGGRKVVFGPILLPQCGNVRRWGIIGQFFSCYENFRFSIFTLARVTWMALLDSCGQTLELMLSRQPRSPAPSLAGAISIARITAAVSLARHRPLPRADRRLPFPLASSPLPRSLTNLPHASSSTKSDFFPPPGSRICSGGARSVEPR
jgi:hypothetical protein